MISLYSISLYCAYDTTTGRFYFLTARSTKLYFPNDRCSAGGYTSSNTYADWIWTCNNGGTRRSSPKPCAIKVLWGCAGGCPCSSDSNYCAESPRMTREFYPWHWNSKSAHTIA